MNVNAGMCKEHRRLVEERHCKRQESRTAWLRQAIKIVFWRETHVCRLYFPFLWPNAALSGQLHLHCDAHGVPVSQLSRIFLPSLSTVAPSLLFTRFPFSSIVLFISTLVSSFPSTFLSVQRAPIDRLPGKSPPILF